MRAFKRMVLLLLCICLPLSVGISASAETPQTYFYSYATGEAVATVSPSAYLYKESFTPGMESPEDFCRYEDMWLVADSGANAVFVLDQQFKLIRTINAVGQLGALSGPSGICVLQDGTLCIADTGNGRLVFCTILGEEIRSIKLQAAEELRSKFIPVKVSVGKDRQIYVISRNDYSGIVELDEKGNFLGYLGATNVTFNLKDYIWKKLMSETQKDKQIQFIPVEYVNMTVDDEGFIYAISSSQTESTPVRKLNPAGIDILSRHGYSASVDGDVGVRSSLTDICYDKSGLYHVLDNRYGRVFTYDSDGYLLYVFGNLGTKVGYAVQPVALESDRENIWILDKGSASIIRYSITDYALDIVSGIEQYQSGKYEQSLITWKKVLKQNSNYEIAYAQTGKSLLRLGEYKEAMHYFKLGNFRGDMVVKQSGYNKAFSLYRNALLARWWWAGLLAFFALIALIAVGKRRFRATKIGWIVSVRESRFIQHCRLSKYILFHPFKGFWDMKREKEGSLPFSLGLIVLWIATEVLKAHVTGFLFAESAVQVPDILSIVRSCAIIFVLITAGNWCVTTLMNGEGSYRDIVMAFGHSTLPLTLIGIPLSFLTNFLTYSEISYVRLLETVAVLWFVYLLFFGIQTIHQYTLRKNIATVLLTVFAALVLVFVAMVFIKLILQVATFASAIFKEMMLR